MKESILNQVVICPVCHKAYIPETDICNCLELEEPRVDQSSFENVAINEF